MAQGMVRIRSGPRCIGGFVFIPRVEGTSFICSGHRGGCAALVFCGCIWPGLIQAWSAGEDGPSLADGRMAGYRQPAGDYGADFRIRCVAPAGSDTAYRRFSRVGDRSPAWRVVAVPEHLRRGDGGVHPGAANAARPLKPPRFYARGRLAGTAGGNARPAVHPLPAAERIARLLLHAAGAAGQGFLGRLLRPETGFARAVMYGDAVQLLRQAPWLGQGGDTWRHAFRSLQSTPYVGSEVHSGYLDLALDIGLPGLALVLLWLALQGVQLIRRRSAMLPSYVAILLHSAIDFDMSYGLIWLLLLWMAADAVRPGRFMISRKRPLRPAICLLAAVCLVLLGLSGLRQATSLKLYQQALSRYAAPSTEERRFEAASKLLRRALELAPYRNQARIALASRSNTTEKVSLLRQGLSYEPADARLWLALGRALAESNHAGTVPALRQAVALDRFDHKGQTMVLQEVLQLAQRLREQGQMQEALEVADAGLALYEEYAEQAEMMRLTLARNDRQFNLTGEAEEWGKKLQEISNSFSWNDHDQQVRR